MRYDITYADAVDEVQYGVFTHQGVLDFFATSPVDKGELSRALSFLGVGSSIISGSYIITKVPDDYEG